MNYSQQMQSYREQPQPPGLFHPQVQGWMQVQSAAPGQRSPMLLGEYDRQTIKMYVRSYPASKIHCDVYVTEGAFPTLKDYQWGAFGSGVASRSILSRLDEIYVIQDRIQVPRFIETNHLLLILQQAYKPLNIAFGGTSLKTLSLECDDEGFCTLFCLVMFPGSLQEAQQALKEFDHHWWLGHSQQFVGKLDFDFELV